jgi:hypothetical protein
MKVLKFVTAIVLGSTLAANAAVTTLAWYRGGEADAGAIAGSSLPTMSGDLSNPTFVSKDSSGNGYDLAKGSGVIWSNEVPPAARLRLGASFMSYGFASGSYLSGALTSGLVTTANVNVGMECWTKSSTSEIAQFFCSTGTNTGMGIWRWGDSFVGVLPGINTFGDTPATSEWTHLAIVATDDGWTGLYINGAQVGGFPCNPSVPTGEFSLGGGYLSGLIDEVRVFSFDSGKFDVNDLNYVPKSEVDTPVFSPNGGVYSAGQTVTISCPTSDVTIYYTTDNSEPVPGTGTSQLYTGPITVSATATLKAKAWKNDYNPSPVKAAYYYISSGIGEATTLAWYRGGEADPEVLAGSALPTMNGNLTSPAYQCIDSACGLNLVSGNGVLWSSDTPPAAKMRFGASSLSYEFPAGGTGLSNALPRGIVTSATSNFGIECWVKTTTSNLYQFFCHTGSGNGLGIWRSENLFYGVLSGINTFGDTAATSEWTHLAIVATDDNMTRLFVNGVLSGEFDCLPIASSGSFSLGGGNFCGLIDEIRVFSFASDKFNVNELNYVKTATPTFSLARGYYQSEQNVTIQCATPGATIRYTTDGTIPTEDSLVYASSILVDQSMMLKARAWAPELNPSDIQSVLYGIAAPADWSGCVNINGQFSIPMGWYAMFGVDNYPAFNPTVLDECQQHGFAYSMPYFNADMEGLAEYLDYAQSIGVKVLIDLHNGATVQPSWIASTVNQWKNHPAVYGYYLDDEPDIRNITPETLFVLYQTVKENDPNPNHPVFLTLWKPLSTDPLFLLAADIVVREIYTAPLITEVAADAQLAKDAGKSFMIAPLASTDLGFTPTAAEFKYNVFGPIAAGAGGIMPYIFETVGGLNPIADPSVFRNPVVYPVTDILKAITPELLLGQGNLSVAGNFTQGVTRIAGTANDAVLIAVNHEIEAQNSVVLTVEGINPAITQAQVLGENRTLSINGNTIIDNFAARGVHIYKFLCQQIPGDANGDGSVDVGDLGILAANYGGTGKTWSQGDFNGDGAVDVGDLGILAAHYGQGPNASQNFTADYSKVFGTSVSQEENNEETDSSVCSALGLPLIAGFALVGLMLVKLDE